jgi:hypothetical protein
MRTAATFHGEATGFVEGRLTRPPATRVVARLAANTFACRPGAAGTRAGALTDLPRVLTGNAEVGLTRRATPATRLAGIAVEWVFAGCAATPAPALACLAGGVVERCLAWGAEVCGCLAGCAASAAAFPCLAGGVVEWVFACVEV